MCKRHDIYLDLRRAKKVTYSGTITCSGWFDCDSKELVVAMRHPDALGILVHEYAHITQWLDYLDGKFPLWKTASTSIGKYNAWLDGESTPNISMHVARGRDLELDNERRSVRIIREWGLDSIIDVDDYIRKANSYIHFYNWMRKYRRWSSSNKAPYTTPSIIAHMSNKFNMKYDKLSPKIERLFNDAGI